MSLNRAIKSGKEHRKQYTGAKAVDATCRNHGSCKRCCGNRMYKNEKRELAAEQSQDDFIGLNESIDEFYSFLGIKNQEQEIRNTLNLGTLNENLKD